MEKISITRALRELKLVDSKIVKQINDTTFLDVYQGRKKDFAMISKKSVAEFTEIVTSKYQSINDLIDRKQKIKRAIMKSNAETNVKISGQEYLVIDAIEKKNSVGYQIALLKSLKEDRLNVDSNIDRNNDQLNTQIETMVNNALQTDKKVEKETYNQISEPILEANEMKVIDPLKIDKEIDRLEKEIEDFESEVDFVLSESNSQTYVEV